MYEIELKFPLPDPGPVRARLAELGARAEPAVRQRDVYFRHPSRDFAQTNEAFRMRTTGDEVRITYKGPVIDTQVKVRREIELPVGHSVRDAAALEELLTLLGFTPVRPVEKTRVPHKVEWEGRTLEVTLDTVAELGSYLEIEGIAPEKERNAVRDSVLRLADRLGLANPERKSYLRLLLEKDGTRPA